MISVQDHGRPRQKRLSVTPFIIPFVAFPDFISPPKSGDKLYKKFAGPSETKL